MGISRLDVFLGVEVASKISISATLSVNHRNFLAATNDHSYLKVCWWFWSNVPLFWSLLRKDVARDNFKPALDHTLAHAAGWMVELSVFNWFDLQAVPLEAEISIFKIHFGGTNDFITEDHVIVPDLDRQRRGAWHIRLKVVALVEVGVWLIKLIVISLTVLLAIAQEFEVSIGS